MRGVEDVGDPPHGLGADLPRVLRLAQGPDRDAGEAVPEAGQGDGVLVLGDEELARGRDGEDLVVDVGLGAQALEFSFGLDGHVVDCDELLVEVVEGRARGAQPVLERRHVAHGGVQVVQVAHRAGRVCRVLLVLLGGEGAGPGQLVGLGGAVDVVALADDEVVAAGEEAVGVLQARGLAGGRKLALAHARGQHAGAHDVHDVLVAGVRGQVVGHAAAVVLGRDVPVVEVPVVVGDDLEEVRNASELGDRVSELIGAEGVQLLPGPVLAAYQARLLGRGLEVAAAAERAVVPVGLVVDGVVVRVWRGQGTVAATGDGPHLCARQEVLLFDSAVGQSDDGAIGARELGSHTCIVPVFRVGPSWPDATPCARLRPRRGHRCARSARAIGRRRTRRS